MKRILAIVFATAIVWPAAAKGDWNGKIIDEKGEPVAYANVALISQNDSSIIAAAITDIDGNYYIKTDSKKGIIMVAMLGYKPQYLEPQANQSITLAEDVQMIEGATVSAVMPKTELTGEGLQTNVKGSVLENAGTANDVLNKTPGLIKTKDGLEVIGKGTPLVYINGRKVTDETELDRLLSNEIQKIEVITNPGAAYDASVRAVVKIKTVKRKGDGFGLNLRASDEQRLIYGFNSPSGNLKMNYRKDNWDFFLGGDYFQWSDRQNSKIGSESFTKTKYIRNADLIYDYVSKRFGVNGGVNWQINEKHSVGFKVEWNERYDSPQKQMTNEVLYKEGVRMDSVMTVSNINVGKPKPQRLSSNVYYNGDIGKLNIDFNFDIYKQKDSEKSAIEESSEAEGKRSINNSSSSTNDMYATKLILSYPIWKGRLQVGTEETFTRRSDEYKIDIEEIPSSSSKAREDVIAAFASYGFALEKVGQINAGVRYEFVDYRYDSGNPDDKENLNRKYSNFFPSLSYANQFGPVQTMLNASVKTERPGFWQLSDAVHYNDRYILQSGNSKLQPEYLTNVEMNVLWKFLVLNASYTRTDQKVAQWYEPYKTPQGEVKEEIIFLKPVNLDSPTRNLNVFLVATPTIWKIWALNYTVGIMSQWLKIDMTDPLDQTKIKTIDYSGDIFFGRLYNTVKLKKGWQLELGGQLMSKGVYETFWLTSNNFDLSAAVQKSFLKDESLVVRLEGFNLTNSNNFNVFMDYGAYNGFQTNKNDPSIKLSIRYNFNNATSKYKGTGAGSDAVSRMGSGK